MSVDPFDDDGNDEESYQQVTDEEGSVDQQVKNRILTARQRVDDAETQLYVTAPSSTGISAEQQYVGYVTMVRQFIRAIKPLLSADEIPRSDYYRNEVLLYKQQVAPPAGRHNWPRFVFEDKKDTKIQREMGLPPNFNPPEAKKVEIKGLSEILATDQVTLRWSIDVSGTPEPGSENTDNLTKTINLEKRVFDAAVEQADAFLQQAGIGMEIGHRQQDDPDDDPF